MIRPPRPAIAGRQISGGGEGEWGGHFPRTQTALKCLYLFTRSRDPTGAGRSQGGLWKPPQTVAVTFAVNGFTVSEMAPFTECDKVENLWRHVRACTLVLMIVLSAVAYGSFIFVSDSVPTQSAEADGRDLGNPISGSAPPATKTNDAISPVGAALPVGNLPGWTQVFTEDFTGGNVPIGGFPGAAYGAKWSANYFDGTPDTAGQMDGGKSGYYPSKVLSVHDGVLDMYLHSENGIPMGAAPAPKLEGNQPRPFNSQLYGRYSVRFKSDALKGFKTAWLLWPDSGLWPQDGEIDYPEGEVSGNFYAAMHGTGPNQDVIDVFEANTSFTSWHIATTEWSPGRVEFFLDGRSIGVSTSAIPNKPMHYVIQTESCLPACPLPGISGHVYVDWVAIWAKS